MEREKAKDDSIAMLADQLLTLTERLKKLERKQQSQFQFNCFFIGFIIFRCYKISLKKGNQKNPIKLLRFIVTFHY